LGRINQAFGLTLQELRRQKGLSQEELAFEAQLSRNYISLLETGQRSPTLDTLQVLSRALETTITYMTSCVENRLLERPDDDH
jgi:transcriptional regulator with XRE-family HTH domain